MYEPHGTSASHDRNTSKYSMQKKGKVEGLESRQRLLDSKQAEKQKAVRNRRHLPKCTAKVSPIREQFAGTHARKK